MVKYLTILLLLLTSPASNAEPIGIAHNNPLNIVRTAQTWEGEVECSDVRKEPDGTLSECFIDPIYGLRAAMKLLQNYEKRGFNTVDKIISRWATGNQNTYIRFMKQHMIDTAPIWIGTNGVFSRPTMMDGRYMVSFIMGMIIFENGYNPYTPEQLAAAWNML